MTGKNDFSELVDYRNNRRENVKHTELRDLEWEAASLESASSVASTAKAAQELHPIKTADPDLPNKFAQLSLFMTFSVLGGGVRRC